MTTSAPTMPPSPVSRRDAAGHMAPGGLGRARRALSLVVIGCAACTLLAQTATSNAAPARLYSFQIDTAKQAEAASRLTNYGNELISAIRTARDAMLVGGTAPVAAAQATVRQARRTEFARTDSALILLEKLLAAEFQSWQRYEATSDALARSEVQKAQEIVPTIGEAYRLLPAELGQGWSRVSRVLEEPGLYKTLSERVLAEVPAANLMKQYDAHRANNRWAEAVRCLVEVVRDYALSSQNAKAKEALDAQWGKAWDEIEAARGREDLATATSKISVYAEWFSIDPYLAQLKAAYREITNEELNIELANQLNDNMRRVRTRYVELLGQKFAKLPSEDPRRSFIDQLRNRLSGNENQVVTELPMSQTYRALFAQMWEAKSYKQMFPLMDTFISFAAPNTPDQRALRTIKEEYQNQFFAQVRAGKIDATAADWYFWKTSGIAVTSERPERDDEKRNRLAVGRGTASLYYTDVSIVNGEWDWDLLLGDGTDPARWPDSLQFYCKAEGARGGLTIRLTIAKDGRSPFRAQVVEHGQNGGAHRQQFTDIPNSSNNRVNIRVSIDDGEISVKVMGTEVFSNKEEDNLYFAQRSGGFGFELTGFNAFIEIRRFKFSGEQAPE